MNNDDIRQLIGEATEYDKKQALEVKKPKSWCKCVSAFANGIGGKLVWGIADDGTLVGLADAKGVYVNSSDDTEESNDRGGQKAGQKSGQKEGGKTIDTIHELIKDNPSITRRMLAQIVDISPSAIQKHINHLKADGIIVCRGGDRGGIGKS